MKKEYLGYILGAICFLPSFLVVLATGITNIGLAIVVLLTTQSLWLWSIALCTMELEVKNKKLREIIEELKVEKINNSFKE
jgi:hypothetical protein